MLLPHQCLPLMSPHPDTNNCDCRYDDHRNYDYYCKPYLNSFILLLKKMTGILPACDDPKSFRSDQYYNNIYSPEIFIHQITNNLRIQNILFRLKRKDQALSEKYPVHLIAIELFNRLGGVFRLVHHPFVLPINLFS